LDQAAQEALYCKLFLRGSTMNRSFILATALLFFTLFIAACGGGGGGGGNDDDDDEDEVRTGVFIDGPVEGLSYETASQSGLTNADGEFEYLAGETVSFSIGGIELGSAEGAAELNPFDLFDMTPPATELALRLELNTRNDVTDFDRAANIAFLLVSLDNDADPDNGIDLTGWNSDLADAELDFDVNLYTFARRFRSFAGTYDINSDIVPTGPLAHLYDSLGITIPIHLVTSVITDSGNNGSDNFVLAYGYDTNGFTNSFQVDSDADGIFSQSQSYSHTARGRGLSFLFESDTDEDGMPDFSQNQTSSYNSDGDLATFVNESDINGDGPENRQTTTHVYDDLGRRESSQMAIDTDVDTFTDEIVDYSYTYDADNNLLTEVQESDSNLDSVYDSVETFTYTYDGAGNQLTRLQERDTGIDMDIDFRQSEVRTYDEDGNVLTYLKELDFNGDDDLDDFESFTYTYDSNGNMLTSIFEGRSDGETIDERTRHTYSYNGNGTLRLSEFRQNDSNLNGVYSDADDYNHTTTYTYDGFGNWLSQFQQVDNDADAAVDQTNLTEHSYTTISDGMTSLLFHYSDLTLF
jgi:hypothetical protein